MNSSQDSQSRNRVVPRLEALEDRLLMSALAHATPPRIGGVAFAQAGGLLELGVGPPRFPGIGISSAVILEDGKGNVAVEWDGGPVHFFSGVNTITLAADAPGNVAVLIATNPLQTPQTVGPLMTGAVNSFFALVPPGSAPLNVQANPGVFSLVL